MYFCTFDFSGGSKSKKMKLTVKGGAAVDPDTGYTPNLSLSQFSLPLNTGHFLCWCVLISIMHCCCSGLENCAHVLDQNGKIYSATLGLVDIVRGTNSYYKLQLLEDDVQKRWGTAALGVSHHLICLILCFWSNPVISCGSASPEVSLETYPFPSLYFKSRKSFTRKWF